MKARLSFYEKQGVTIYPGAATILGNAPDMIKYNQHVLKQVGQNEKGHLIYLGDKFARDNGDKMYDGAKHPIMCMNILNDLLLYVSDPDVVKDMFTTKMKKIDKDRDAHRVSEPMMGNGLIFSSAQDHDYLSRRKHV